VADRGGTFIHLEETPELIRDVFALDQASDESEQGTVQKVKPLLNDSFDVGDTLNFEDADMAFANVSTTFVEANENPNACLACKWNNGSGSIYYAADTSAKVGTTTTFTEADEAFSETEAGTKNITLEFGKDHTGADLKTVQKRNVLVNTTSGIERGKLHLVFWR
jgi:hypothetical protein